jgi:hypothetical protein
MIAAVFAAAAAAAVGDGRTGTTAPAATKANWLLIRGFWPSGTGPWIEGAASGRGWLGFPRGDGVSRSTILGSIRRVGGKTSFAKTVLPKSQGPMMIVGPQLYYHLPDISGKPGELRTVPLLANGKLGAPSAAPVDPETVPPKQFDPVVVDGIQVGDRVVWILAGGGSSAFYLWACCTRAGELSPLTRLIDPKRDMASLQLGLDSRGRLWLAWLDMLRRKSWGGARMVELDPDTLSPRTAKPLVSPGSDTWVQPLRLVCGSLCRATAVSLRGGINTWAPGERATTLMPLGTRSQPAGLLDMSFSSGKLVVGSVKTLTYRRPPWSAEEISIVRGDARGAHARKVTSTAPVPFKPSSRYMWQPPMYGAFVPGALVFFKLYYNFRGGDSRVLVGSLPVGR